MTRKYTKAAQSKLESIYFFMQNIRSELYTAVNRKGLTHVHIALYKPVCKFTQWFIQRYVHIALYKPLCKFTQWFIQHYMHMGQPFPINIATC